MRFLLFSFFSFCLLFSLKAQTGPGGVGNSTTNTLWLRSSDISQADGSAVTSWSDQSGNGNNASQGDAAYQPTFQTGEINGFGVVSFNGIDEFLDDARSYNARTIFALYRMSSARQNTGDLAQIWGNYSQAQVALDARALGRWSFDGSTTNSGRFGLNGAAYTGFNRNPNSPQWSYDQFELVTTEFNATRALTRQVIGSLFPDFTIGTHQFGGDLAEIIVFNTTLNTAQRRIVENYIAAKYNLTIANDFYSYQLTHSNEVAGIGRASAGNEHTAARSSNILQVENASSLNNSDYLLFGHDNGGVASWQTTESPDGGTNISHLSREWIFSETGDVGTVDFVVDVNDLPAQPGTHNMYALLIDDDGDFSSGASVYEIALQSGTEYGVSGIEISDGQYATVASMRGIIEHSLSSSSGSETNNATFDVRLNFFPESNISVDYNTANGTAAAGSDYTAASVTLIINAGDTTDSYTINVTNDVAIESNETFTSTLSSPSRLAIGDNNIHTFSIIDDDNPRKIYFDLSTSNNSENITSGNIAVSINLTDGANPTSVDYAVTGGTATGGGNDFTLASGTLIIPSGLSTEDISFTVNNDLLSETNETFIVTLSNPTNCNLDASAPLGGTGFISHTYTINDNDPQPTIDFNTITGIGNESVTPITFQIDLSAISGADVDVDYTVTGTATGGGTDYLLADGTLTINSGDLNSNAISAIIVDDAIEELSETIVITLSNPVNATLGVDSVFTYSIVDNDNNNIGRFGPGGVGESSTLPLFLRAEDIAQADGTPISSWPDNSGNSHDATQGTPANQPEFRENIINSHPTVRFDGDNDFFTDPHSYSARTVFVVFQMLSANQDAFQLGQLWGSYSEDVQVGPDGRSVGNWSLDGGGSTTGRISVDGGAYGGFAANPTSPNWAYDVFEIVKVEFDATMPVTRQDIGSLINPAPHYLGADIAELVVFNRTLSSARELIIENYLSAKYDLTVATDIYAHDAPGSFENEVAGIGRINSSSFHLDAQGSDIVRINNPSDLDDDEFFIWGHNNLTQGARDSVDVPALVEARFRKVWKVSEVDQAGSAVDVGSVDIQFDLNDISDDVDSVEHLQLLIDTDNDNAFADEAPIGGAVDLGGKIFQFSGVSGISNNNSFTLGTSNKTLTPLPIELVLFTAENINNEMIMLKWETASEINNDFFTIEKSYDGINWEKLAIIQGAGNSSSTLSYSHIDKDLKNGMVYYRLKQTDFDKKHSYSRVQKISISVFSELLIFPNPTLNEISVISNKSELENIRLFNAIGQDITNQVSLNTYSNTNITISLSSLKPGVYFVKTNNYSKAVIKQ